MSDFMTKIRKYTPLIILPLVALMACMQVRFALMGDKGWLLLAAEQLRSGKQFTLDIFEINPPLILWLYAIPIWLSVHCIFLSDYQALAITGLCAVALSIRLCLLVIAHHPAFANRKREQSLFVMLLASLFIFMTNPIYFFDREHIMLVFTFPYILRFMPSLAERDFSPMLRIGIGVMAAIGFCIKPHALAVFAALQLVNYVRSRSFLALFSFENGIVLLFMAGYALAVYVTAPDYFHDLLPMALATYSEYRITDSRRVLLSTALVLTVIPFLDFRRKYQTPYRADAYYFMAVTAAYLLYALINNGWGYTYHPMFAMLLFLTCWLMWEYAWLKYQHKALGEPFSQFDFGMRACLFSIMANVLYGILTLQALFIYNACGGYSDCALNEPYVSYLQKNNLHSFGVMSGEFNKWPEIGRAADAKWVTRFNHLWMFPAIRNAGPERSPAIESALHYVGAAYAEDLDVHRPEVVFVDDSDEFFTYHRPIDILALLKTVPAFASAWQYYRYDAQVNTCKSLDPVKYTLTAGCHYDIYRRVDSPATPDKH